MRTTSMLSLTSLVTLALVAGCDTESSQLPSEPDAGVRAHRSPPQFSDWSAPISLGPVVNSTLTDIEVSISKDGLSLYLASNRPDGFGGFDIWVSQRARREEPWGPPQNLGPSINTSANEQGPALTRNGRQLFFFSDRAGGFGGSDVYVSQRRSKRDDFGWQAPVNLGSGVNTAFNENLPHYFKKRESGTVTLYFSSNRPGGCGGTDIYVATLQPDETFGATGHVPELCSPLRDAGMAIRRDGLEMILASDRAGTVGSFDLWVTTRASAQDPWSTPLNLGPVVNTVTDESRVALSHDGTALYIVSGRPGGSGNLDIWVSNRSKIVDVDDEGDDDDQDNGDDEGGHMRDRRH